MNVISWNVNGIRSAFNKGLLTWINRESPDILCLQEIKSGFKEVPDELKYLTNYTSYIFPSARKGYSGTAVFSKLRPERVTYGIGRKEFDSEGRTIILEYKDFFLINSYFPHGSRDKSDLPFKMRMYKLFLEKLKLFDKPVIVCGDFNVAHEEIDLARPKNNKNNTMFTKEERSMVTSIIEAGFIDTFRYINKEKIEYTWWPYRNNLRSRNVGWRIDYIFISKQLANKLRSAGIQTLVKGSDHCPISVNIII
ncbi:Endonuclease/Exonuclease/phosphatase family protein [Candidatus Tiddalikarchaeum anstoanum]|nr:Endonuclease/Exonuclease/phosphatase family protein [Candidatus Tiddalikarchaeum anstoanum]